MATRSLSPSRVAQKVREHRHAVLVLARLAAKKAVQEQLRAQGVRVTLVRPAEITERAKAYLEQHPELYQQSLERALRMGLIKQHPLAIER